MNQLLELVRKVADYVYCSEREEEMYRRQGEGFNIFEIMKLETSATEIHSAILAELLTPKGSHGVGDVFLKAFVEIMGLDDLEMDTLSAEVQLECPLDWSVFGKDSLWRLKENTYPPSRIDILIKSKRKAIFIQNQMYTGYQSSLLEPYFYHAKKHYPAGFRLVYLTLYGNLSSEYSNNHSDKKLTPYRDYYPMSCSGQLRLWLKRCIALANNYPLVRETIRQYKSYIEHKIGIHKSERSHQQLVALLTRKENIKATVEILSAAEDVRQVICNQFLKQLEDWVTEKGWLFWGNISDVKKFFSIHIYKEEYLPWSICFRHNPHTLGVHYSIAVLQGYLIRKKEKREQKAYFARETHRYAPFGYQYFEPYLHWDDIHTLRDMLNGKMLKAMQKVIEPIMRDIESGVINLKD